MMKITFVIDDLFAQGAQYATALMVRGFIASGYSVDLVLSKVHKDLLAEGKTPFEIPPSANVLYLSNRRARHNVGQLRRYLWRTDSKALVSMSPNYTWALRLARMGLFKCPKIVHVEHGIIGYDNGFELPVPKLNSKKGLKQRFLFSGIDKVLTVSAAGKRDFERYVPYYNPDDVYPVYNPCIDDVFWRKVSCDTRHPWLVDKPCPTWITAGAFQPYKDHLTLLRAWKIVNEKTRARLVIFGKGPLESDYRAFISDNHLDDAIAFGGFTDNFPAEAKSADGFVLPSHRESFGIVLVEALGCGLPVVSTDAPFGPREILADGKFGRLVPRSDPDALAQAILAAIGEGKKSPPDESWKRFTLEAAVERYEKGIGIK